MAFSYEWYDKEQGIMLVKIEGDWGWDEFYPIHKEYCVVANNLGKRVDFIFDFSRARMVIPESVFSNVKTLTKIALEMVEQWGVTVFLFPSALFTTVIGTFTRMNPSLATHYRMADTMDKALSTIAIERQK